VAAGCWGLPLVLGTIKAVCEESEEVLGERKKTASNHLCFSPRIARKPTWSVGGKLKPA